MLHILRKRDRWWLSWLVFIEILSFIQAYLCFIFLRCHKPSSHPYPFHFAHHFSPLPPQPQSMLLNKHTLHITKALQPAQTPLAPHPTLLVSPKRRKRAHLQMRIHPDRPSLQLRRDPSPLLEVLRPYTGTQSHLRVVRPTQDFFFRRPREEGNDWSYRASARCINKGGMG
jgi:hypothetical protein